jgi:hypothetical protein
VAPRYELRVAGSVDPSTAEAFGGMDVAFDGELIVLRGELDQAALHGLLQRIRSLHLQLIDVRRIRAPRRPDTG